MVACAAEMPHEYTTSSASASSTSRSHQRFATTSPALPRVANLTSTCRPSTNTPNFGRSPPADEPGGCSCDRRLGEFRVINAGSDNVFECLPPGKRLITNDEIAGQILTPPRRRDQNVVIGPISQARRQPEIDVHRGEVPSEESGRSGVCERCRQPVPHRAGRHPDGLMRHQRDQFACRPGNSILGHSKQRKTGSVEVVP